MSATIELYEDQGGEWRWRLRHENGNVIADSGEGYSSKSNAKRAIERAKEHGANATALDVTPAAFEIYEDRGGKWRWRLRHANGNIVADSGQGYESRSNVVRAIEGVKRNAPAAGVDEE